MKREPGNMRNRVNLDRCKKKVFVCSNMAPIYRRGIYGLMDERFDITWHFGKSADGIDEMDITQLKHADYTMITSMMGITWQHGAVSRWLSAKWDGTIMMGDIKYLSTWIILLLRRILNGNQILLWSHGWYGNEKGIRKWVKRVFYCLADGALLYGDYARTIALSQGNAGHKLHVIHNSLDYATQKILRGGNLRSDIYSRHFGNDYPTVIFLGRLTKVKKLSQLLNAVARLDRDGLKLNVVLVGDGPERAMLERMACDAEIRAWFYGECYNEGQNAELIYNADICVSPGNIGLTAIHSLMFGTPVITHDNFVNQMPEFEAVKDNITGCFFKEDDIESLAGAIKTWLCEKVEKREEIRTRCYEEIDSKWNPFVQMRLLERLL